MLTTTASCRKAARTSWTATSSSIVNYFSYTTGVRVRAYWHAFLLYTGQEIIYINKTIVIVVVVAVIAVQGIACCYQVPSAISDVIIIIEISTYILLLNNIILVILS
jgi:hypothetical protein